MATRYLYQFCIGMVVIFYKVTDAVWTLSGSSQFAVANESFILTCNPNGVSVVAINWRRSGTIIASIDYTNRCEIQNGSDTQYQYACEPGPAYKLTIPANVMTNSQNNIVWRCMSAFGGVGNNAEYILQVAVPVRRVNIQGESGYQAVNAIYENVPKTFTCITNGCRPKANTTVTTTGLTEGQRTERQSTQSDGLIVTTVSLTITATRGDNLKTIECFAVNIQGIQPVTSKTLTLEVFYSPVISLDESSVVVSEGHTIRRTCSVVGNPKPTVNWYKNNIPYTSGTVTTATLIIEKTTRNDSGTYTCKAEASVWNGSQRQIIKKKVLNVTVYYLTLNKPAPVCSSSNSIGISCCSAINSLKPLRFYGWKHRIGNTTVRSLNGKQLTASNNSLSLEYCGYYDSGVYTCEAAVDIDNNNQWHHFNSSIEITVPASPVISYSRELNMDVNNRSTLSVQFYSEPKPDIVEWIKDGEKLTFSNKHQQITLVANVKLLFYSQYVLVKGYESSLSIDNPVDSDYGTYIFKVQNSKGSAQRKLNLNKNIISDINEGNITGIAIGSAIIFIAVISIAVFGVCVFKRRHKRKNDVPGDQIVSKDLNAEMSTCSNNRDRGDRSDQDCNIQTYETLASPCTETNQYESLPE